MWSSRTTIALAIAVCTFLPAQTPPPMVKTQPGFYRMMLGDFEITALNDGVVDYPTAQVLPHATPDAIKTGLAGLGLSDPVGMSYNAFLINTGRKLILIDTGTGGKLQELPLFRGTGRLAANLRAAGYLPEQVDEVYISHFGPDHVGGLTSSEGKPTFPNAILRVSKSEADIVLVPDSGPAWTKQWIPFWSALIQPYIKAGRFASFEGDITLAPGVRALATHGHSPGHTSYVVESKGKRLIVLGDLVLIGALQFRRPSLTSGYDSDPDAAAIQRKRILQLAADEDDWVAGMHLSFPGIGHVRAGREGYLWIPASYTIPR